MERLVGQPASQGALPTLRAVLDETTTGAYYGPKNWFHLRGAPVKVRLLCGIRNEKPNCTLWDESERLTDDYC